MAKRKLDSITVGPYTVTTYRDSEWDEYVVVTRKAGIKHSGASDYHTTDRDDAIATAKHIAKGLE